MWKVGEIFPRALQDTKNEGKGVAMVLLDHCAQPGESWLSQIKQKDFSGFIQGGDVAYIIYTLFHLGKIRWIDNICKNFWNSQNSLDLKSK